MSNIVRDGDVVELNRPPKYRYGDKVRSTRMVRNDGTYPGKDIGEVLVKKGEEGVVTSIGTFLQQFYIYGVDFPITGHRVGMRARELVGLAELAGDDDDLPCALPAARRAPQVEARP